MTKSKTFRKSTTITAAVVIMMALAIAAFLYLNTKDASHPTVENVLTIEGEVTMILHSCGAETLHPEEDVSRYAVCDQAEGIRVDDKVIKTSSAGVETPRFKVDISSIALGDIVSVHYIEDESRGASLNCDSCSITVTKNSTSR